MTSKVIVHLSVVICIDKRQSTCNKHHCSQVWYANIFIKKQTNSIPHFFCKKDLKPCVALLLAARVFFIWTQMWQFQYYIVLPKRRRPQIRFWIFQIFYHFCESLWKFSKDSSNWSKNDLISKHFCIFFPINSYFHA